jgi:TPR repeat protein
MDFFKKIFTVLFGLQVAGCASSDVNSEFKRYTAEESFRSEYNEARDYINKGLYTKALNILDELEQECYPPAIYSLYEMYNNAHGVKQDKKKALEYLQKAFAYGYPLAEYDMAIKMLKGKDIAKEPQKAITILKQLGDRLKDESSGENHIFYRLQARTFVTIAKIYFEGKYIPKDLNKAAEYGYIIGSLPPTQEDNIGKDLLGEAYLLFGKILIDPEAKNIKVSWDPFVAFGYAIDMGNLEGYYEKGLVYLNENNLQFAADTFGLGCSSGHDPSCYEAGVLYENEKVYKLGDKNEYGKVRENPLMIATRYYEEGARLGSEKCQEKLKNLQ